MYNLPLDRWARSITSYKPNSKTFSIDTVTVQVSNMVSEGHYFFFEHLNIIGVHQVDFDKAIAALELCKDWMRIKEEVREALSDD